MDLIIKAKNGDMKAKEELLRLYRPLIASSVKKYNVNKQAREDLQQEAAYAFLKAIDKYDATKGKFGSFAGKCIFGQLKNYFHRNLRRTKIPTEYLENKQSTDYTKIHDALFKLPIVHRDILMTKLGFWDHPVSLEVKYGITKSRVSQILKEATSILKKEVNR